MTDKSTGELETEMVTIKGPYQSEKWIIATNKKVIPQIKTLAIFAYQTIGVEVDMLPDLHLSGFARGLIQKNIKHYTKFQDAIEDFKSGKIDAVAGLKSQLEYLIDYKNNKDKYYLSENILFLEPLILSSIYVNILEKSIDIFLYFYILGT